MESLRGDQHALYHHTINCDDVLHPTKDIYRIGLEKSPLEWYKYRDSSPEKTPGQDEAKLERGMAEKQMPRHKPRYAEKQMPWHKPPHADEDAKSSCSDDSHTIPEIPNSQKAIEQLYRTYTWCSKCHETDLLIVKDTDGHILMKQCAHCSEGFGVDDSISPELLLELYHRGLMHINVNCCANTDPDCFRVEGFNGQNFLVYCFQCDRVSPIVNVEHEQHGCDEEESSSPEGKVKCKCGNQDEKKMTVSANTPEESFLLKCDLCEELVVEWEKGLSTSDEEFDPDYIDCSCKPHDKKIHIEKDATGEVEMIACTTCNLCFLPKDPNAFTKHRSGRGNQSWRSEHQSRVGKKSWRPNRKTKEDKKQFCDIKSADAKDEVKYREVSSFRDLRRGDHIKWDRPISIDHHAIVERVMTSRDRISVIHYQPVDGAKGKIISEELDPFTADSGRLHVVEHSIHPFSRDEVVHRAYSHIGDDGYHIFQCNCEHFATWCVTGRKNSSQSTGLLDGVFKCALSSLPSVVPYLAKAASESIAGFAAKLGIKATVKGVGRAAGLAAVGIVDGVCAAKETYDAVQDYRAGRKTAGAAIEVGVSGAARVAGGLAGTYLGGICLPIPYVGAFIGGTVGALIGETVGKWLCRGFRWIGEKLRGK